MGYLKNIMTECVDGLNAPSFFSNKIEIDKFDIFCKDAASIPGIIDKYKSILSSFKYEYPTVFGANQFNSKEGFYDFVHNKIATHQLKFPAYIQEDHTCKNILELCSEIIYLIDCYLYNSSVTASSDAINRFNDLVLTLTSHTKSMYECNFGGEYDISGKTIVGAIDDRLCPYALYDLDSKNFESHTDFFTPEQLFKYLFKLDIIVDKIFCIDQDDEYDELKTGIHKEYGPCGDLFQSIIHDKSVANLPEDLQNVLFKTVIIMDICVKSELDYLEDIYNFAKNYILYLNDEFDLEHDECNNIYAEELPKSLSCRLPSKDIKSIEADAVISNSVMAKDAGVTTNNIAASEITENYKSKYLKFQKTINEIKVKYMKARQKSNSKFFKQWYGRIPSMYTTYGGSAMVTENRMKGDPTQILLTSGVQYLETVTKDSEKIFSDIVMVCKKVTSAGDINAKLNAVKAYCQQYTIDGDDVDPKTIKMQIVNESCYRIAKAILQENGVYGYTAEGIVENHKFPTCNHIVVSLFIENAQEKPEEQSVSSIFESPEGLMVYAHPEKLNVLNTNFSKSTAAVMTSFNPNMIGAVHKNLNGNYKMFTATLVKNAASAREQSDDYDPQADDVSRTKKIAKAINDGLVESINVAVEQKKRCIQCVGAMFEMSGRIQELAKRCIAALRQEELRHSDTKYNSGTKSRSLDKSVKSSNKRNDRNSGKVSSKITRDEIAEKRHDQIANMHSFTYS